MPLRHRHGYPAALHRGLPADIDKTTEEFPYQRETPPAGLLAHRTRPMSARFGAGKPLRDVEAGSCSYSSPSRSPDPHHLAVLTRSGFVRAAPTHTRHLPGQTTLGFTAQLRQGRRQKVSHLLLKQQRLTAHVDPGLASIHRSALMC